MSWTEALALVMAGGPLFVEVLLHMLKVHAMDGICNSTLPLPHVQRVAVGASLCSLHGRRCAKRCSVGQYPTMHFYQHLVRSGQTRGFG
eukprot:2560403-Amphidinium_carterae.2